LIDCTIKKTCLDVLQGQPPETDDLIELGMDMLQDAGKSTGRRGGGGGFGGGGGGGQCVASDAGYSKQQEAGLTPGGSGVPSGSVGGFPVPSSWNGMPDCAMSSATGPGIGQPGGPVFGTGLPFGACGPDMGGNVSYLSTPGGISGGLSNMEMPPPYADDVNKGSNLAAENSPASNVNVAGSRTLPDDHHPVAGGVPVLPDVSLHCLVHKLCYLNELNCNFKKLKRQLMFVFLCVMPSISYK